MSNDVTTALRSIVQDALDCPAEHVETSAQVPMADLNTSERTASSLNAAQPLDPLTFPNPPRPGSSFPPATIPNINHLIASYGIAVSSNVITKKLQISLPNQPMNPDYGTSSAMTQIISLATLNGIAHGQIWSYVEAIGNNTPYNPVAEWIEGTPWDGFDRLPSMYNTLVTTEEFPVSLKHTLVRKWLLSAVAAALKPSGFKGRGVLTFQGPQGIGKTSWLMSLVPDSGLRDKVVKVGHHLDPSNKDSILGAIAHWLVEIGELDSSFRKDVARLKGFLTSDSDKVRRPYGRIESEYPRKTVFFATVNDNNFLVDSTGNSRWWTIPLMSINYQHHIDMQQLFAQLADEFKKGAEWWLATEEEAELAASNSNHQTQSVVRELITDALNLERKVDHKDTAMSAITLLRTMGIERPSNMQCKECGSILRELYGAPKKIQGSYKWRIPLKDHYTSLPKPKSLASTNDADY